MQTIEPQISKEHLLEWVRSYGEDNSDAVLSPGIRTFSSPVISGFIGYRQVGEVAIVFGDPVAQEADKFSLASKFHAFCKQQKFGLIFVAASASFRDAVFPSLCSISLEFGEKCFFNPQDNPYDHHGDRGSLVRRKVRRAKGMGVTVHEYVEACAETETALENVVTGWLASRKGRQIYLSAIALFSYRAGKRWFYAKAQEKVIGVLVLNRIEARSGWLLNHVMTVPEAPSGTSEALIIFALETVAKEGCEFVTVGSVPKSSLQSVQGIRGVIQLFVSGLYRILVKTLNLMRLREFWSKFEPKAEPSLLLLGDVPFSLKALLSLLKGLHMK